MIVWCRATFSDAFGAWIHLKVIRLFVEVARTDWHSFLFFFFEKYFLFFSSLLRANVSRVKTWSWAVCFVFFCWSFCCLRRRFCVMVFQPISAILPFCLWRATQRTCGRLWTPTMRLLDPRCYSRTKMIRIRLPWSPTLFIAVFMCR